MIKSGIDVSGLFPGAKYDIQVRAKNAANSDFGQYGDVSTSTDFTQISSGQYINTDDLNNVTHNGLNFSLENTRSIDCYVNGSNSRSTRTIIGNSTSYIDITGTSEFYVNYGLQGTDMSGVNDLVQATVELKKTILLYHLRQLHTTEHPIRITFLRLQLIFLMAVLHFISLVPAPIIPMKVQQEIIIRDSYIALHFLEQIPMS